MIDLDGLRPRLEAFLGSAMDAPVVVDGMRLLTGGYSLVTIRFTASTPDGKRDYVLRANPPADAALTRTDRRREWELLDALTAADAVPMPAARWADPGGAALGTPAIVIDYVDGPQLLGHLKGCDEAEQRRLALDLAVTIGAVHRAGEAVVPATFERPSSWDAYVDGFIAGWRELEMRLPEHNPFIRWVAKWLDSHRPSPAPLTLVHGEFQTGNVMVDADGTQKIIDWEYAHVGDPRVDLGWMQNVAAFMPPDPIALDPVAFCRRYCEVTGLSDDVVNPLTIAWWAVGAGYKALASFLEGIAGVAAGTNHLVTSAYLVSAVPFTHRLWRENVRGLEAAMSMVEAQVEAAS